MPKLHATLSASGAKRWMNCTPSARLEERLKDIVGESTSDFAQEGTLAHSLSELKLLRFKGTMGDPDGINEHNFDVRRAELGDIPSDMEFYTQVYVDNVIERFLSAKAVSNTAMLFIEQRLDFSQWVPEGFGTGDAVIISDESLEICDLKYGRGVPVYAENNPQARCYGLGAINEFGVLFDFDVVRNTIIQPRLDSITEETISREELLDWGENTLKPLAELAFKGEGEFKPGEHCQFCVARAICAARVEAAMQTFKHGFASPDVIPDEQIPEVLKYADITDAWIKDLRAYALGRALDGHKWRGLKLVEGRKGRRTWTDKEAVEEELIRAGYKREDFEEKPTLKSVAMVEKLLGKKAFSALMNDFVMQPNGALTLVDEADERTEYNTADAAFKFMEDLENG